MGIRFTPSFAVGVQRRPPRRISPLLQDLLREWSHSRGVWCREGRRHSLFLPSRLLLAVWEAQRGCGRRSESERGAVEAVCPRLKGGGGQMTPERSSFRSCHFVMERPNNTQVAAPGQRGRGRGSLWRPDIDPSAAGRKGHFGLKRLCLMRRYSRGD